MYIRTIEEKNVIGFFTDKEGTSVSPYMNQDVRESLGLTEMPWVRIQQVHKDDIAIIEEKPAGDVVLGEYDGIISLVEGVCLATVHADCTPVQLYDPRKRICAAVHAGWRGTALGIAGKAASIMKEQYGCEDIIGYVGPAISLCCFEVGKEVSEEFRSKYSWADEYIEDRGEKDHIDLKGINERQLKEAGVAEIIVSDLCTYCNNDFVSFRRENGTKLRMANGICMLP